MDNTTRTYTAIQRVFRNSIVGYMRGRLLAAFGDESPAKLRRPFTADEWSKMHAGSQEPRVLGNITAPVCDDFDLLSVNHFYNLFDAYWEHLKPSTAELGASPEGARKGLLAFLRDVKIVRDPISHPVESDLPREDAFRVIDSARRVLKMLGLPEATELNNILDEIWNEPDEPPTPLVARLPPSDAIVQRFIGRDTELLDLWAWLTDSESRRWILVGDGGKGKSALAYEFACQVRDRAPRSLDAVIWLSAKQRRFAEGAILSDINPDFASLGDALTHILVFYDREPDPDTPSRELIGRCLQFLDELPALLIIDDVDSIGTEDEDAIEFFSARVINTRSKVLFTSRRTHLGFGRTTTLMQGFNLEEGRQFVESRIGMFGLDRRAFTNDAMKRLIRITDGSPLYLEELLRLAGSTASVEQAMSAWSERGGAEARRYALGRECELLSQTAREVLFAAAVARGPVSYEELRAISGVRDEALTSALQELQRLFLIPKPVAMDEYSGEWRFELNRNTRMLVEEVNGQRVEYRRAADAHRAITQGLPRDKRGYSASAIRQAAFLMRNGEMHEAEEILIRAKAQTPNDPDVFGFLGYLYKQWVPRRSTDAREAFRRASELRSRKPDAYFHWIRMELDAKDGPVACEAAEAGLKRFPSDRTLLYWAGRAYDIAARQLESGFHFERADHARRRAVQYLTQALDADEDGVAPPSAGKIFKALALTAEASRDMKSVARYCASWEKVALEEAHSDWDWQRLTRLNERREMGGERSDAEA